MKKMLPLLGLKNPENNQGQHAGFPKSSRKLKRLQKLRSKKNIFRYSKADKARMQAAINARLEQSRKDNEVFLVGPPRCGQGFCFNKECFITLACQENERKNGRPFTRV